MTVFVEQPLALPGSAKKISLRGWHPTKMSLNLSDWPHTDSPGPTSLFFSIVHKRETTDMNCFFCLFCLWDTHQTSISFFLRR